jgi:hypothetical protein
MSHADMIKSEYDRISFTIPYMIYQRMNQWWIVDSITLNFHLVTATITIYLCTNWQISLFMSFYLICSGFLVYRAAKELYSNGQSSRKSDKEINVIQAHELNKTYMQKANEILLRVRTNQWRWQYSLLIFSMIIAYPTPILL